MSGKGPEAHGSGLCIADAGWEKGKRHHFFSCFPVFVPDLACCIAAARVTCRVETDMKDLMSFCIDEMLED